MTGYVRQSTADIIAGQDIKALPLSNEFNAIEVAFNSTTGHTHDGTTGSGPKIDLVNSVTNKLPPTRGGTGSNLSIITGDMIIGSGAGTMNRVGIGSDGYVWTSNGTTASWVAIPTVNSGNFIDSTTFIVDNDDTTKKIAFEASGITTGTTRTFTAPNSSGTLILDTAPQTLTNKSLQDSTTLFVDDLDATKKFLFELSNITTSTTRIVTIPDASGILAYTNVAQTLSALNTITRSNSTTLTTYLEFTPTDYGSGKPKFYIQKSNTASVWNLGLFDSINNAGTINFVATTGLTWNGTQLVDLSTSQTLTSKTLTSPIISDMTINDGYTEEVAVANTSSAYTIDLTNGTVQNLTLTASCTFTFPTATAGKSFLLILKQNGTGGWSATWPASVKWPSSLAPTITTVASKADLFAFTADGSNWLGRTIGQLYL